MFNYHKKINFSIQIITIIFLLVLPYYLFDGKLFIGGDDSRLFYIYPWEWITHIALYSWFHLSAVGTNNPNQFILPFLLLWTLISKIVYSQVSIDYLSVSLPLILGFIYFQKLLKEFVDDDKWENTFIIYVGSFIYIFSPIIATNQLSIFLYSIWLIGLLPLISFYFIRYLKTGNFSYVIINIFWCFILSLALVAIPWLLGFFFPIILSLIFPAFFYNKERIIMFFKRIVVFFGLLLISQAFWVYSFIINILFSARNSYLGKVLSKGVSDTFSSTVLSTATGNIFYPLLNLFHRQMSIDYNSQLRPIFIYFYDKTIIFDLIFPIIIFTSLFIFKKHLSNNEKIPFIFFLISFLLSLFFFTVNIGPFNNIFLFMGNIPGFVMFRNFYDKFALGYTLLYAIVLTLSLIIITRRFEKMKLILPLVVLLIVLVNVIPYKNVVNKPLWTTRDIYTDITIPNEYTQFMNRVKNTVPQTANILSLPFNIAGYTIIKDENTNNVFAGRSPVQLFTGINDFSGNLSFSPQDNMRFINDMTSRNYKDLNKFLVMHNIGYVFVTNNIPQEVKKSYLFDKKVMAFQDKRLLQAITGNKLLSSSQGNYVLYQAKYSTALFSSKDFSYKEISPVMYSLTFKNMKSPQSLNFIDSYSTGWKLYPVQNSNSQSNVNELSLLFKNDIFSNSHIVLNDYANSWIIDPNQFKNSFSSNYYQVNKDGSITMTLLLYFKPQENFYIGAFISFITVIGSLVYLILSKGRVK